MSAQQSGKQREKRVDKEIYLLRNLPNHYKLAKKETQLGMLIDVSIYVIIVQLEIQKEALGNSKLIDSSIQFYYFDILLRDKYPFQPPIIMTRTNVSLLGVMTFQFCKPSLADGRDLLSDIIACKPAGKQAN